MSKHYITCKHCQTENLNTDYCTNCGEIINIVLERQLEQQRVKEERIQKEILREPTAIEKFFLTLRNHSNPFVRVLYIIVHTVWLVVATIAAGIAYLVGMIAA
ncbi:MULTISPECIES: hypothetical protein [Myroides]|uniref:Uncharacterized protein n=1 Tax=Myroides odoratus TaxID=256 RepID=A0A9Q6Z450_MYROD|nr:hypothetical protein [Myroides odoratus]EHQ43552.1 hypothetical protein Myrod_2731 [Myroides odoratus DSM 2801]EKB05887.1 hypothetical protein HMPREF9716_02596 [Myroides odoratus CIP 103059]QQU00879.1 hypothetical protein I6I88_03720 [Myroides odoratus]WQD56874.1 hypothetical protein U0010_15305 [Myroides odoratus]STZ30829.1 Uncharacterised protein [Myroides odoratus]